MKGQCQAINWNQGSFRDPDGCVFEHEGEIYRTLTNLEQVRIAIQAPSVQDLMRDGDLVQTEIIENHIKEIGDTHILHHQRIPFIAYPYEWSFLMLQDAALLTLRVLKKLLQDDYWLKDGTAFNIAFRGDKPVFLDFLSIAPYKEGQVWAGYQQFCDEFVYPLLIQSYCGVHFQSSLRGSLKGVSLHDVRGYLTWFDIFKPGVFKYVLLPSWFKKSTSAEQKNISNRYRLSKKNFLLMLGGLENVIRRLKPQKNSVWIDYESNNTYQDADQSQKEDFVREWSASIPKSWVIDLGCNAGHYSLIVSQAQHQVVSADADPNCVDTVYKRVADQSIWPIVFDIMNPSPHMGFALGERTSLFERIQFGGFLSLALIHHICVGANVPLERYIAWLATVAPGGGILEWVDPIDPMVQFLTRYRPHIYQSYNRENFDRILRQHFKVVKTIEINQGKRALYWLGAL